LAQEAENAKAALGEKVAAMQAQSATQGKDRVAGFVTAANAAAANLVLDETETPQLIDEQLRLAGWTANSTRLRYATGARPEKGKNLAIAEWPTASGPADYVLFVGLQPMAAVEATCRNIDVSAALQQAKRYSCDFTASDATSTQTDAATSRSPYRLPFAFATNGRPYLRQLATRSGVWFCDLRRPDNLGRALDGWYTPEGLTALLKRDEKRADTQLQSEPFTYGFSLRPYQQAAIQAAEGAIAQGQREMLLTMATGTGKTKTCIALIYRLLKTQRCRRVLFLVNRSALGEQAANAFKDTRMESLQTFAAVFGIKELDEQSPDSDTAVHIATVQGMWCSVFSTPARTAHRQPSIVTTASSSTSVTAATCSIANSPTPNSTSAVSTTTSRSTGAFSTDDSKRLKAVSLVEGRYPNLLVAGRVAAAVGEKTRHIRDRGLDGQYYEDMVVALVREHQPVARADIDGLLLDTQPEVLTPEHELNRIHNLLRKLAETGLIVNRGSRRRPKWISTDARHPAGKSKETNGGKH
jgi:hypothetical protein